MANEQQKPTPNTIPTGANTERPTGKAVVYIGCKLPNGITLELIKRVAEDVWNPAPTGKRVTLKGANNVRESGILGASQLEHPFSLTAVDASFWEQWLAAPGNAELAFIANGQVFAVDEKGMASTAKQRAKDMAKERMSVKTGLEAINPAVDDKGRMVDPRLKTIAVKGRPETAVTTDTARLESLMTGMMDAA